MKALRWFASLMLSCVPWVVVSIACTSLLGWHVWVVYAAMFWVKSLADYEGVTKAQFRWSKRIADAERENDNYHVELKDAYECLTNALRERDTWKSRAHDAFDDLMALTDKRDELAKVARYAERELRTCRTHLQHVRRQVGHLDNENARLAKLADERGKRLAENDTLLPMLDAQAFAIDQLGAERDRLIAERDKRIVDAAETRSMWRFLWLTPFG